MKNILVAPSVLSANFSEVGKEIEKINNSGSDWVHLDVMDGLFVPNITFGPKFIKDNRNTSSLVFDTHLMIINPERYIKQFADAGSDFITIHVESCKDVANTLNLIKSFGCKAGISLNPETDISSVIPFLDLIDLVLVMTVHPGFGGQSFITDCLDKIKALKEVRGNRSYLISVDGGINLETAKLTIESGADVLVTGSSFFNSSDKELFVKELKEL